MDIRMQMRRSLLSLALMALVGAAAVAQARDETMIAVKTRAGTIERVDAGDIGTLAIGETRALSTRNGSAATLTRTDAGLVLAIAGDQYPIDMPDVDVELAHGPHIAKHVESGAGGPATHEAHKVVVIKHADASGDGDATDAGLAGLGIPDLDDDEALLAAGDGPKVFVRRLRVADDDAVR